MTKEIPTFRVRVINADKVTFDVQAKSLSASNRLGRFDILPDHRPFITLLSQGDVMIRKPDKSLEQVTLERGILKFTNNDLVILTNL